MTYLVCDKDGEFIDILEFTAEELAKYKMSNPLHTTEPCDISDDPSLLEEDDDHDDVSDEDEWPK